VDRPPAAAALRRRRPGDAGRRGGRQRADLRGRRVQGPGARPAAGGHRRHPGRPHQRRRGRGDRGRHPGAAGAGAQRRRGGRADRGPAAGLHPGPGGGRPRRARGRDLPGRLDPLPALPGLAAGRADGRAGRPRGRGPGRPVAAGGPGHAGHRRRSVCRRRHPRPRRPAGRGRRRVHARRGHPRDRGAHVGRAVRGFAGRRSVRQRGPGRWSPPWRRGTWPRPGSTTSPARCCPPTTRWRPCPTWC
jgi:hypothetical protein